MLPYTDVSRLLVLNDIKLDSFPYSGFWYEVDVKSTENCKCFLGDDGRLHESLNVGFGKITDLAPFALK